jgi:hypothetical protein
VNRSLPHAPIPAPRAPSDTVLLALTGLWGALGTIVSAWVFLDALDQYRTWESLDSQFASADLVRLAATYTLDPGPGATWVSAALLVLLLSTVPLWAARVGVSPRRWDAADRVAVGALASGVLLELVVLFVAGYYGQEPLGGLSGTAGQDPGTIALETAVWALVALLVHAVAAAVLLTVLVRRQRVG